jgi:pectinesterase
VMIVRGIRFVAVVLFFCLKAYAGPAYDFVVSKDSSGNFKSIQEAVNACRDYTERQYVIFVKNGVYEEKLVIPTWKTHITIIGQDVDSTIVTYNDYSGRIDPTGKALRTFTSFTCQVAGNNIVFENVTFANSAGRVGQAVALHVEGDRCVFRNCKFIGNQDTLLASGENARQYFDQCYIEGTTDFIFGAATAFFDRCTIVSKVNSYITAASTPPAKEFGFVFLRCKLLADSVGRKVYLGRPWRLYAFTAFIGCELGEHIRPEGWHNWSKPEAEKTARYMEYKSTGPGANPAARVAWSHQLSDEEVKQFTVKNVLKGFDNWDPTEMK